MATSPWTTVAKQWTLSGIYSRVDRAVLRLLLSATSDEDADARVTSAGLNRMTAFYRQTFMNRFSAEYSDTLSGMETEYTRRLQMATEFQNYSAQTAQVNDAVSQVSLGGVVVGAYPLGSSVFAPTSGVYGLVQNLKPGYWFIDSTNTPINSSLLAGQTNPGDYMADMSSSAAIGLYINQGTKAVPVWVAADSQTLVDLIYNPAELLECGYQRALYFIKTYAVDADDGQFEFRIKTMPSAIQVKLKEVQELENVAFGLLRVDRAANGIISDWDKDASKIEKYFV